MREEVLVATLRQWRRSAHVYGKSDCLLSVADYGGAQCGVDIGAPWRGTYSTEAEALAIVAKAGGAVRLLGGALETGGFRRVQLVERGDPIVGRVLGREIGGIWLGGGRAAFRAGTGLLEVRFNEQGVLGAWRCVG
jgi:hypothetical protein